MNIHMLFPYQIIFMIHDQRSESGPGMKQSLNVRKQGAKAG